ncbi:MAG: hypothetical protein GY756_12825 [bacterium]|nr:hypothetical protein [bacterium]
MAKNVIDLSKAVLLLMDKFYLSKGRYRYTLHDDGEHLFVVFNNEINTTLFSSFSSFSSFLSILVVLYLLILLFRKILLRLKIIRQLS